MTDQPPLSLEQLTVALRSVKEQRKTIVKAYDEKVRRCDEAIARIETVLRAALNSAGLKQCRTSAGLTTLVSKRRYYAKDWEQVYTHILETNDFSMLQKRLGEGAVKAFVDAKDEPPPGVAFTDIVEVKFTPTK